MMQTEWKKLKTMNDEIVEMISEYNNNISCGNYLECSALLNTQVFYDLISAHIINVLIDDSS